MAEGSVAVLRELVAVWDNPRCLDAELWERTMDKARALLEQQQQPEYWTHEQLERMWHDADPKAKGNQISDTGGQANAMQSEKQSTHATVPISVLQELCAACDAILTNGRLNAALSVADRYIASQAQQRESPAGGQQSAKADAGNAEQVSPDVLRDAERYRYLRQIDRADSWSSLLAPNIITSALDIDAAIDAAIAEGKR